MSLFEEEELNVLPRKPLKIVLCAYKKRKCQDQRVLSYLSFYMLIQVVDTGLDSQLQTLQLRSFFSVKQCSFAGISDTTLKCTANAFFPATSSASIPTLLCSDHFLGGSF